MPAVDNLFRASAVDGVTPARVVAVLVAEVAEALREARAVVIRGVVVLGVVPGRRVAAAEPAEARVLLSAAALPGLDRMELALREEVVDFFSSSLALTLGRLLWLDTEVAVVGRRTLGAGGRVGGLLRPPGARVLVAVLAVALEVTPGRRVAVVEATPGRFTAGLDSPFALAGASGEVGVEVEATEVAVSATGEAAVSAAAAGSASAMGSTGGTSSCWTTSKLSDSDIAGGTDWVSVGGL